MLAKRLIWAVILMLLLAVPLRADEPPSITKWGKATIYVVPDRAVVSVTVNSTDDVPAKALADNRANAEKLLNALKAIGIADQDIASGYVSVTPGGGLFGNWIATDDKRFHVLRSYAITLHDLKLIDKVIDTATRNGANQIDGVDLQTSALAKYRDQARQQAIRAAKDKAVLLAKELNATVGKPKTIEETNQYSYAASGGISGGNSVIAGPEETEPSPVFIVGKIPVAAAVRVTFELQ